MPVVVAPLAVVKNDLGAAVYLYAGTEVPSYVRGSQLERLQSEGYVSSDPVVSALSHALLPVTPPPGIASSEVEALAPAGPSSRPAQVANKAAWVEFAVSQGATLEDAEAATKLELVELYGG